MRFVGTAQAKMCRYRALRRRQEQRKLLKEYVREWPVAQGFRGEGTPPLRPDEIRIEAARRYSLGYE